jgi:hypothetical protein
MKKRPVERLRDAYNDVWTLSEMKDGRLSSTPARVNVDENPGAGP